MQVPVYIAAQLGGSITACFALRVMFNTVSNTGITIPSGTALQALAMEVVVSSVLMFVTSAVATDTRAVISTLNDFRISDVQLLCSLFSVGIFLKTSEFQVFSICQNWGLGKT